MKNFKTKSCINNQESKWFLLLVKHDFRRRETPYFKTQRPGLKKKTQLRQLRGQGFKKMAANSLTLYKTHIQLRSFRWLPDTSIPSTFQLYVSNGIVLANTTPLQEVVQLPMECFPQEIRLKQLARSTLPQRPRSENRQI